jgi:hypothetical protein
MKIKAILFGGLVMAASQSPMFASAAQAQNSPQNCAPWSIRVADREIGADKRWTQEWIDRQSEVFEYCVNGYGSTPGWDLEPSQCGVPIPGINNHCVSYQRRTKNELLDAVSFRYVDLI